MKQTKKKTINSTLKKKKKDIKSPERNRGH